MRQVACLRNETIMLLCGQAKDAHPQVTPEYASALEALVMGEGIGIGLDYKTGAIVEQIGTTVFKAGFLGASHRVGANKGAVFWQGDSLCLSADAGLGAADIGDNCPRL